MEVFQLLGRLFGTIELSKFERRQMEDTLGRSLQRKRP